MDLPDRSRSELDAPASPLGTPQIQTIHERLSEAVERGWTPERTARSVLRSVDGPTLELLAHEYLVAATEHIVRQREATVRQQAISPAPRKQRRSTTSEATRERDRMDRFDGAVRAVTKIVDDYMSEMKVTWTAELLASTFSNGERRVSWADATVDDHNAHIEMMSRQVAGFVENLAMHRAAIDEITAAGVDTLGQTVGVAA